MALSTEQIKIYREGLKHRLSQNLSEAEEAELDTAHAEAQQLAQILVKKYQAKRVMLFGSVARRLPLHSTSDIDLAVEGMPLEIYYNLVGDLITETGRSVDLIRIEGISAPVKRIVALEGIVLADDTSAKD